MIPISFLGVFSNTFAIVLRESDGKQIGAGIDDEDHESMKALKH
jgi:hypothetical protein